MNKAIFQSTRPVRGATTQKGVPRARKGISIHAPREGRDHLGDVTDHGIVISIHAPREGRDRRVM